MLLGRRVMHTRGVVPGLAPDELQAQRNFVLGPRFKPVRQGCDLRSEVAIDDTLGVNFHNQAVGLTEFKTFPFTR